MFPPSRSWSRRDVLRAAGVGALGVAGVVVAGSAVASCGSSSPAADPDPLHALGRSLAEGPSGRELKASVPAGLRDRLTDPAAVTAVLAERRDDIRADFAARRTVRAEGWQLSTTEGTVLVAYATR